jgi:ketosteroid isomerase-like protein
MVMSLYEKRKKATDEKDVDAWIETLHEDFVMVSHQDGTSKTRDEFAEMVRYFMSSDDFTTRDDRCLFENDEALVEHLVIDYPDGTTEAVLTFCTIKDGKIIRMETGETLIEK